MPIQEPCVHLQFPVHHEAGQATSSPCADSLWVLAVTRPVQHDHSLFCKGSLDKAGFVNSLHADCWLGFLDLGLEERWF